MILLLPFMGQRLRLSVLSPYFFKKLLMLEKIIWLKVEYVKLKSELNTYGNASMDP